MAVDRGRAKYFHGRKEEIKKFKDLLTRSIKDKVGTTFLIQGSPGVGKSALKFELSKRAKNWHVIEIDPTALYDLKDFRDSLGLENWFEFWKNEVLHLKRSVSIVNVDLKIPLTRHTFRKSLNEIKKPTLIVLDEAQRLKEEVKDVSEKKTIRDVLNNIHNLETENGFVFLIVGLGTTQDILKEFQISRFAKNTLVNLECLDEKSEREILKQYMIKEGGANENDPKLNPWIDEIVNHTYGWAQHIISYGETTAEYLQRNNHLLSDKGLKEVLISGLELRHQFYRYRLDGFRTSECQLLVDFLKANQELKSFSDEPIIHFFNQKYHNEEKSEQLFEKALERGLFHQNKNMRYVIPVPSMRTWLTEKLELY